MQIDELVKWGTFLGAVIAGATGLYTTYLKYRDDSVRVKVGLGPVHATISPYEEMHVINCGNKAAHLADYGFIENDGSLFSALIESELEPDAWGGKFLNKLEPGDHLCVGFQGYSRMVVGAYAKCASSEKLWTTFSPQLSFLRRIGMTVQIKHKNS